MILQAIEFLGNSQTFLGVLIALIGLMLYNHDGNLFHRMLEEYCKENDAKIRKLADAGSIDSIYNDENYRTIKRCADSKGDKSHNICKTKMAKIKMRLNSDIVSFQPTEYLDHTKRILEWREVYLAPMFTFFCCFGLFCVDELLRAEWFNYHYDCYLSLVAALIISIIFWVLLWTRYVIDAFRIRPSKDNKAPTGSRDPFLRERLGWLLMIVLLLGLITLLGLHHILNPFQKIALLVILSLLCLVKGIVYMRQLQSHDDSETALGYSYTMKHIPAIVIVSLIYALVIHAVEPQSVEQIADVEIAEWFTTLKYWIFLAVMVNGIFLPLIIPIIINWIVGVQAKKEWEQIETKNKAAIDKQRKDLENFVKVKKIS